jgi:uncharacterized protein
MASSQFFALFDDIATLLDDVAAMTKVATQKTAGVLGDDLALNAEQVAGVSAARELPVVWAVAKGSLINKFILVPTALLISAALPAAITPLLIIGGLYLCFEGAEKILHNFDRKSKESDNQVVEIIKSLPNEADVLAFEKRKIKGAIRTDFILSAEIVVISLGVVAEKVLIEKAIVLSVIAFLMTTAVYGLVGLIVKLDDIGFYLNAKKSRTAKFFGLGLIKSAPKLMKSLSWIGLVAMFLVGGGILVHGIEPLHHLLDHIENFKTLLENGFNLVVGLTAGFIVLGSLELFKKIKSEIFGHKT